LLAVVKNSLYYVLATVTNRSFANEKFITKVAGISLGEDVNHLFVLTKFTWSQKFHGAKVAFETRMLSSMEF
jgi:hypothetical protein